MRNIYRFARRIPIIISMRVSYENLLDNWPIRNVYSLAMIIYLRISIRVAIRFGMRIPIRSAHEELLLGLLWNYYGNAYDGIWNCMRNLMRIPIGLIWIAIINGMNGLWKCMKWSMELPMKSYEKRLWMGHENSINNWSLRILISIPIGCLFSCPIKCLWESLMKILWKDLWKDLRIYVQRQHFNHTFLILLLRFHWY